mmetsp:Transcript_31908/g.70304  ORF Transcript_31908/g.70304 Transcript_31908/m.70304 type:complete len:204 (+) Transcript_31908:186-797(+)
MAGPGGGAGGSGTGHHRGAARGDAQQPHQHRLRPRGGEGVRLQARRDGARAHVRRGLPQGHAHHPPGRDLVLRGRQHGPHPDQGVARAGAGEARQRAGCDEAVRREVQVHAHLGLHALPACATDHSGQALHSVDAGPGAGLHRPRGTHRGPAHARGQGHHGHAGYFSRAVRRRPREGEGVEQARMREDGVQHVVVRVGPDLQP